MRESTQTRRAAGATATENQMADADRQPTQDLMQYLRCYARERPDVAALWCFGVGFVLGWKLKPW